MKESEIDSPKKQTIYLLGAVAAMTVLLWGAARFACNAHPAASKRPRHATTNQLAGTAKGAAIELQDRWATYHFVEALELARGDVEKQLSKELEECEADLSACDAKRDALEGKVHTMGEVLNLDARTAKVKVTTTVDDQSPKAYLIELTAEGPLWKVVKRTSE